MLTGGASWPRWGIPARWWIRARRICGSRRGPDTGDTETRGHGDPLQLVRAGQPLPYSEEAASAIFAGPEITVAVKLGLGDGQATVWTCDLSHDYVSIQRALSDVVECYHCVHN